jgi:hypothetical protein
VFRSSEGIFDKAGRHRRRINSITGVAGRARHRSAVNDELLAAVLQSGFSDPGEPLGPIVTAAGDQPDGGAVALDAQAVR